MSDLNPESQIRTPHVRARFRDDVGLMVGSQFVHMLLTIASSALVARALGPSGRGVYAVAFALVGILIQFGSFGLSASNTHFVAQLRDRNAVIVNSTLFAIGFGAVLIASAIGLKIWIPDVISGVSWSQLAIVLPAIPFALAGIFFRAVLLGEARTVAYNVIDLTIGIVGFALLVAGLAIWDFRVDALLAIVTASYVISAIAYLVLLVGPDHDFRATDRALARDMVTYGFRIYLAGLLLFLIINLDLLMVNSYLGSEQAGYYSAVTAMVNALTVFPVVVGVNLFPRISSGGDQSVTAGLFRIVAVIYGAACIVSIPLAAPAVRILFGPEFESVAGLYYWIVPGAFSLGMAYVLSQHFAGRGFPIEAIVVWIPGVAINVLINVLFIPEHGAYIAALSSSITYTLILLLHMRMFAREGGGYRAFVPRPRETVEAIGAMIPRIGRRHA